MPQQPYVSHLDVDALVAQALAAGVHRSKVAAEASDDKDDKDEGEKDNKFKPKEKAKKEDEGAEKEAQLLQLADLNIKVAAQLRKQANAATALPTSAVSAPGGSYPAQFGQGKQQVPDTKKLEGAMPTKDVADSATKSASLKARIKRANDSTALPSTTIAQGSGKPSPVAIGSNQAIIDAKANVGSAEKRKDLREAFKEPALTSSTDTTLNEAFQHTEGNKLASARELFVQLQREAGR